MRFKLKYTFESEIGKIKKMLSIHSGIILNRLFVRLAIFSTGIDLQKKICCILSQFGKHICLVERYQPNCGNLLKIMSLNMKLNYLKEIIICLSGEI